MWIIQNDLLVQLPGDAPLPPGSRAISVPDEFLSDPHQFRIEKGELVRVDTTPRAQTDKLTREEISQLKQALASGALRASAGTPAPDTDADTTQQRRKKKEEK